METIVTKEQDVKTAIMRRVELPPAISGELWLGPMPGRLHPLQDGLTAFGAKKIDGIVCLTPMDEIAGKSPDYASRLDQGFPMPVTAMPSTDFGVPSDEAAFIRTAQEAARDIGAGRRIFVHCAAGIGRTGTFAACILIAMGFGETAALDTIRKAGSGPETDEQAALVHRFADVTGLKP